MIGTLTGLMELDNMEFNDFVDVDEAVTQRDKQADNIIDQAKASGEAEEDEEISKSPPNVINKHFLQRTGL